MEKLYDLTELREMSDNDEGFVFEMIESFLKNNNEYLNELNRAFEKQDLKQVKFFAHKIKPSILLFKIDQLKQDILDLNEFAGKQINIEKIEALINGITLEMNRIFVSLNKKIQDR
jgi:HPt (histidine-containing phosphotransfer) domain-containing protein